MKVKTKIKASAKTEGEISVLIEADYYNYVLNSTEKSVKDLNRAIELEFLNVKNDKSLYENQNIEIKSMIMTFKEYKQDRFVIVEYEGEEWTEGNIYIEKKSDDDYTIKYCDDIISPHNYEMVDTVKRIVAKSLRNLGFENYSIEIEDYKAIDWENEISKMNLKELYENGISYDE